MSSETGIIVSPVARDISEIPSNVSLGNYVLGHLRANLPRLHGKDWIVDVNTGTRIKFDDVEDLSKRVASALVRLGFNKGDVFYFVTYDMALLFVVHFAVWRLGGITRGRYQRDLPEIYESQIVESQARFILYDEDTAPILDKVLNDIGWPVTRFCFGEVQGAIPVSQLLMDDGSAFPENIVINSREDVVIIPSTSGSTGQSKGVFHTHYSLIAAMHSFRVYFITGNSVLSAMVNCAIGCYSLIIESLCVGGTVNFIGKLNNHEYIDHILKYKPDALLMYPYFASWFARSACIKQIDLSHLKFIAIGGAPLDYGSLKLLNEVLPHVAIHQIYGMTECLYITHTHIKIDPIFTIPIFETKDDKLISSGKLLPYFQAKIVDTETGRSLKHTERGEVVVKCPSRMLGYTSDVQQTSNDNLDADGWFHTGDFGFFDEDENIYVIERINFLYKYNNFPIMPSDIEAKLLEHEAVHSAGVVGVPNPETDNLTRAFVVVRSGASVTASELENFIKDRLPIHKWLHGGVRFIDVLPQNKNGKLDRKALKELALKD